MQLNPIPCIVLKEGMARTKPTKLQKKKDITQIRITISCNTFHKVHPTMSAVPQYVYYSQWTIS